MLRLNNLTRSVVKVVNLSRRSVKLQSSRSISSIQHKINQQSTHYQLELKRPALSVSFNHIRCFSTKKNEEEVDAIEADEIQDNPADFLHTHLPATVAIPEIWPYLPCIAVSRNPVFPRFMKILEVKYHTLKPTLIIIF